jgi:CubicO group peptidase (beta-lactamase class C family)
MRLQKVIRLFGQLLLVVALAQVALAQNGSLNGFDDYVQKAMKEWEVPGVAIAIVKGDQIVLAKGYGVRKIGEPAVVDEHTLFAIGSSSKAFTAASVAILVDQGKLKWDDPVTKYLPGFEMYDPYVTRELTVRDLLTHRSGLQRGDFLWYGSELDRDEIVRRARFIKPSWSLRSTFGYQNIMYLTAGQLVARVSGKTWDEFIQQCIFAPLSMTSSSTSISAFKTADNVASPHAKVDEKVSAIPWRNIDNIAPAGSINSNVLDMAQWVRLQLNQGAIKNERVFSAAAAKEMHASQTIIRFEPPYAMWYPDAHFLNYGMGWFLSDYRGRKVVEHGGAIDGMRAEVAVIPAAGDAKIFVTFALNAQGKVETLVLGMPGMADYPFKRVAEK